MTHPSVTTAISVDTAPTMLGFDPSQAWDLHPGVAVRPEPFGALLYHFGTRRLTFLKDRLLLEVVRALAGAESASMACRAAGVQPLDEARYTASLARLAQTQMLVPRLPA